MAGPAADVTAAVDATAGCGDGPRGRAGSDAGRLAATAAAAAGRTNLVTGRRAYRRICRRSSCRLPRQAIGPANATLWNHAAARPPPRSTNAGAMERRSKAGRGGNGGRPRAARRRPVASIQPPRMPESALVAQSPAAKTKRWLMLRCPASTTHAAGASQARPRFGQEPGATVSPAHSAASTARKLPSDSASRPSVKGPARTPDSQSPPRHPPARPGPPGGRGWGAGQRLGRLGHQTHAQPPRQRCARASASSVAARVRRRSTARRGSRPAGPPPAWQAGEQMASGSTADRSCRRPRAGGSRRRDRPTADRTAAAGGRPVPGGVSADRSGWARPGSAAPRPPRRAGPDRCRPRPASSRRGSAPAAGRGTAFPASRRDQRQPHAGAAAAGRTGAAPRDARRRRRAGRCRWRSGTGVGMRRRPTRLEPSSRCGSGCRA